MLRELNLINREAILLMIEHAAEEAAAKAVRLYAEQNPVTHTEDDDRLLTKKEAALYLGIGIQTLDKWRKDDPVNPTIKTTMVGGTRPRFKMSDLKATLDGDNVTK